MFEKITEDDIAGYADHVSADLDSNCRVRI